MGNSKSLKLASGSQDERSDMMMKTSNETVNSQNAFSQFKREYSKSIEYTTLELPNHIPNKTEIVNKLHDFVLEESKHGLISEKLTRSNRQVGMLPFLTDPELFYSMFFHWMVARTAIPSTIIQSLRTIYNTDISNYEIENMIYGFLNEEFVPIKLYIKEIGDYSDETGFKLLMKRFMANQTDYGLVHLGVQVGPLIIDWNNGEIVTPRPFLSGSGRVIAIIDLNNNQHRFSKDLFIKISEICCEFNSRVRYDWKQSKISSLGNNNPSSNCHMFAKYLLNKLNIKPWWKKDGPIAKFIKAVKNNGTQKGVAYDGIFIDDVQVLNQTMSEKFPNGGLSTDEEFQLLRGFERALLISGNQITTFTTGIKNDKGGILTFQEKRDLTNAWRDDS